MRGTVLAVGDTWSNGLISGDDGARYPFSLSEILHGGTVSPGTVVDFVVADGLARQIVVLQAAAPPAPSAAQPYSPAQTSFHADIPAAPPHLSPWGYFIRCLTTAFAQGEGRAGLAEYWSFVLIRLALWLGVFFVVLCLAIALSAGSPSSEPSDAALTVIGFAFLIFVLVELVLVIPGIAVLIRRLHDIDQSGFWCFIGLVPMGGLVLFVMTLMPATRGANRYGHPPR